MEPVVWLLLLAALAYCLALAAPRLILLAKWRSSTSSVVGLAQPQRFAGAVGGLTFAGRPATDLVMTPSRYAAFVLRTGTLAHDVAYWNSVSVVLGAQAQKSIFLVGFCDGSACAAAAEKLSGLRFPVVEYTGLNDWQALLSADDRGQFLVLSPEAAILRRDVWRGGAVAPAAVAHEIGR